MRTACALMVMPRSRSRSMSSRICACISRPVTEPVSSRRRSLNVDFPWSMWAMMAKLRRRRASMRGLAKRAQDADQARTLLTLAYHRGTCGSWDPWVPALPHAAFQYRARLENLDCGGVAGGCGDTLVPGDERGFQFFGESHVGRVVSAEILPEPPDPVEKQYRSVARDAQRGQIVDCLGGPFRRQCSFAHQTPHDLGKFHIEQMHGEQGLSLRPRSRPRWLIDALFDALPSRSLKHPVDDGRSVQHNHRAARSSRNRPPVSSVAVNRVRPCNRARNS